MPWHMKVLLVSMSYINNNCYYKGKNLFLLKIYNHLRVDQTIIEITFISSSK